MITRDGLESLTTTTMMTSLTSLTSVLCVLALVLLPTYGMCPAQCQCANKTVLCKGEMSNFVS